MTSHTNTFDLEKEKAKITAIKFGADFQTARTKWFVVKSILDAIHRKLPPLEDAGGVIKEVINLNDGSLNSEQKEMLAVVLKHAYDMGVLSYLNTDGDAVISSVPVSRFIEGENILVEDLDKFESHKAKIDDLCDFIEKEGKRKFADIAKQKKPTRNSTPIKPSGLTAANRKKLCILEKLKEEWDLAPTDYEKNGVRIVLATHISDERYERWIRECELEDEQRLTDILTTFQREGIIVSLRKIANLV